MVVRLLVTKEEYFEAAMSILATDGAGGIKVARLCGALNVTTGSFYGYFGNLGGFVKEFLAYWEESQTERVVAQVADVPDLRSRVQTLRQLTANLPHAAETAIRSWAHTNTDVAEMQKFVDDRRVETLAAILAPGLASEQEAHDLAVFAMTLLVGLQQWRQPVTRTDFDLVFDHFETVVLRARGR